MEGACSAQCKSHPHKRPYDGTGYYVKQSNGYNPYLNAKRAKRSKSVASCLSKEA
jgi:UPF0176 protein